MSGQFSVDTCLLVDIQKETQAGIGGAATNFQHAHRNMTLSLSVVAFGEFVAGFADSAHPAIQRVRLSMELLEIDEQCALKYRELYRHLRSTGQMIGMNDLWIAATALRHGLPLVTRNVEEFSRVPGLKVIGY